MLNQAVTISIRALGGLLLILLAALTSCGGGSGGPNQPVAVPPSGGGGTVEPPPKGLLVALESPDEFKQKIAAGFNTASPERAAALGDGTGSSDGLDGGSDGGSGDDTGGDTDGGSGDDTGGGGDTGGETDGGDFGGDGVPMGDASGGTETVAFTTTYTLETNVDEYDVVKYNGSQLFIAPSRGMDCCVMFEDEVAFDGLDDGGSDDGGSDDGGAEGAATDSTDVAGDVLEMPVRGIRVLTTDAVNGLAQETHRIPLAEDQSVEGLYLVDRNLIALTSTAWWGRHGDQFGRPEGWLNQSVGLESFDLDEDFSARHSIRVEGALVNSRRTEAGIFLVTRHTPAIDGLTYYPASQDEIDQNQNLLEALEPADFLPVIERDGEVLTPVTYDQCYAINPEDDAAPEARGNPILTLVLQIDPDSAEVIDAMCLLESIDGVYLTTTSLYFTAGLYEIGESETLIHQFQLEDGLPYVGSNRLLGGLFLGDNRDYRLNARGGTLRTVLTRWMDDVDDRIDHTLYVLEPASDKPALSIVGQLPNDQRPDELGKPNEDLYGVRFIGDRGYLVTFERTDPLYVIDLTDASDPKIAGTLEIPGFSNFLHPVSESVLMGIGQIDQLAKIEFFDVADLTAPLSLGAIALDSTMDYSYSPAEWNRKAFTYWRRAEDQHRMAIPVEGYLKDSWQWVSRLYLFEINNPADPAALTLTTPGYLSVTEQDGLSLWGEQRSILHEDAVFWVIGQEVITSLWGNPSQAVRAE